MYYAYTMKEMIEDRQQRFLVEADARRLARAAAHGQASLAHRALNMIVQFGQRFASRYEERHNQRELLQAQNLKENSERLITVHK
jgi:hypothetical protein